MSRRRTPSSNTPAPLQVIINFFSRTFENFFKFALIEKLTIVVVLVGGGAGGYGIRFFSERNLPKQNETECRSELNPFKNNEVTVGTLYLDVPIEGKNPSYYWQELESYLERELKRETGERVDVIRDVGRIGGNAEIVNEKLENKEWDIAFLLNSIHADEAINKMGYELIAFNKPLGEPYVQVAIIAPKDGPIKSIEAPFNKDLDLKFAVGSQNSFGMYEVPLFMLYGQTLKIKRIPHAEPKSIISEIKNGKADLGATWYNEYVENEDGIEIIAMSKTYPAGGVVLSPNLNSCEREILKNAMNSAEPSLKKGIGYRDLPKNKLRYDYDRVRIVNKRVQDILNCPNKDRVSESEPLNLFCRIDDIDGKVDGYRNDENGSDVILTLLGAPSDSELVISKDKLMEEIDGLDVLNDISQKCLSITRVGKVSSRGRDRFKFTDNSEIRKLDHCPDR